MQWKTSATRYFGLPVSPAKSAVEMPMFGNGRGARGRGTIAKETALRIRSFSGAHEAWRFAHVD